MRLTWAILLVCAGMTPGCLPPSGAASMRIKFERSGGLFAGNTLEGTVDISGDKNSELKSGNYTRKLTPEETRQIREALQSTDLSQLAGDLRRTDGAVGADQYQYDITIEMPSGATHTFTVGDGPLAPSAAAAPGVAAISGWIRRQAQDISKNR